MFVVENCWNGLWRRNLSLLQRKNFHFFSSFNIKWNFSQLTYEMKSWKSSSSQSHVVDNLRKKGREKRNDFFLPQFTSIILNTENAEKKLNLNTIFVDWFKYIRRFSTISTYDDDDNDERGNYARLFIKKKQSVCELMTMQNAKFVLETCCYVLCFWPISEELFILYIFFFFTFLGLQEIVVVACCCWRGNLFAIFQISEVETSFF